MQKLQHKRNKPLLILHCGFGTNVRVGNDTALGDLNLDIGTAPDALQLFEHEESHAPLHHGPVVCPVMVADPLDDDGTQAAQVAENAQRSKRILTQTQARVARAKRGIVHDIAVLEVDSEGRHGADLGVGQPVVDCELHVPVVSVELIQRKRQQPGLGVDLAARRQQRDMASAQVDVGGVVQFPASVAAFVASPAVVRVADTDPHAAEDVLVD